MNIVVDFVDDILVGPLICSDEAEIVSVTKSDDLLVFKRITKLVLKALERVKDGVEVHEKHNGAKGISLENSSPECKWL